jgi:hypothetical protein
MTPRGFSIGTCDLVSLQNRAAAHMTGHRVIKLRCKRSAPPTRPHWSVHTYCVPPSHSEQVALKVSDSKRMESCDGEREMMAGSS